MKKSTFIIPAIFTCAASFALAQDYKGFDEVDTDKDGELSSQELRMALPGLQTMMTTSRGAASSQGANAGAASSTASGADDMLTREQIARALPGIEFDEETGPIDEDAYDKIVDELEERNIDATTSSPAGATGAANQSARGAAQSSQNSNSPRATQSSPSQDATPGAASRGSASGAGSASGTQSDRNATTQPDRNPNPTRPQTNQ